MALVSSSPADWTRWDWWWPGWFLASLSAALLPFFGVMVVIPMAIAQTRSGWIYLVTLPLQIVIGFSYFIVFQFGFALIAPPLALTAALTSRFPMGWLRSALLVVGLVLFLNGVLLPVC